MVTEGKYLGQTAEAWATDLDSEDPLVRRLALYALAEIGPPAAASTDKVRREMNGEVEHLAVWAAAALCRIDPDEKEGLKALVDALSSKTNFIRSLAVWHLARLGPDHPGIDQCLPSVEQLGEDPDASVRSEANLARKRLHGKGASPFELMCLPHPRRQERL